MPSFPATTLRSSYQAGPGSERPMVVLHLGSPTGLYGAERWILALIRHLPIERIESIVAAVKDAPGDEPAICVEARKSGVRTHVFEAHGKVSWAAVTQLRQFILTQGVDVLHAHGYKTDILGAIAVRGTACKVVSTPHGWSANAGPKLQIYEALDRLSFMFHHAVVPLSADLYGGLKHWPVIRRRLHFIQNGVDLSEVDAASGASSDLAEYKARGVPVVGYVGQLIPRKGIDVLIRAFAALPFADKLLCIVGEGPQRSELEGLAVTLGISAQVRFLGYRQDRIELLKGFDVIALPSSLEGIPRCILESMAARVVAVTTDIPGCRAVVEHGRTGLLFGVGDVAGLTDGLLTVLTNGALRESMANAAEALVRGSFSAESMARHYADLYLSLMRDLGVSGSPSSGEREAS